jgi:hypothetical protein
LRLGIGAPRHRQGSISPRRTRDSQSRNRRRRRIFRDNSAAPRQRPRRSSDTCRRCSHPPPYCRRGRLLVNRARFSGPTEPCDRAYGSVFGPKSHVDPRALGKDGGQRAAEAGACRDNPSLRRKLGQGVRAPRLLSLLTAVSAGHSSRRIEVLTGASRRLRSSAGRAVVMPENLAPGRVRREFLRTRGSTCRSSRSSLFPLWS